MTALLLQAHAFGHHEHIVPTSVRGRFSPFTKHRLWGFEQFVLAKIGSYERQRLEDKGVTLGAAVIGSLYAEGRGVERFKPWTPLHGSLSSATLFFSPRRPASAKLGTGEWLQGGNKNAVQGVARSPNFYAKGRGFERFKPWTAVRGSCLPKTRNLALTELALAKIGSNEWLKCEYEIAARGAISSGILYAGSRGVERFKPWGWTGKYLVDAVPCRPSAAHSGIRFSTPELASTHQTDLLAASLDQQTGQGF